MSLAFITLTFLAERESDTDVEMSWTLGLPLQVIGCLLVPPESPSLQVGKRLCLKRLFCKRFGI